MAQTTTVDAQRLMHSCLQRIATGPELSKDISYEEARTAMRSILEGKVDPVQAGVFLIALRMKRETDDENRGILQGILDTVQSVTAPVDEVLHVADPYDGCTRGLPVSPFLPPVLAACDIPAISHGVESVGPKYGVTHRRILRAAGIDVDLTPTEAAARVGRTDIGWAYVDQKQFCPLLYALIGLRALIVKRPAVTTVEVLTGPIRGRQKTHLMTGYVHKPYPPIYAMLARHAGFASAIIVRGVEGTVIPSLQQPSKMLTFKDGGELQESALNPETLGIRQVNRAVPVPESADDEEKRIDVEALARAAADAGLAALAGERGPAYDSLVYGAALCLLHLGRARSLEAAAGMARSAIDSGAALARVRAQPPAPTRAS